MSDGFFVADFPATIEVGSTVVVAGAEAHHMAVRRIRHSEIVTLTDGQGRGIVGPVVAMSPDHVEIHVDATEEFHQRGPRLSVIQALPKKDRADQAIDLMTEVGVHRIIPWQASRCVTRWSEDKAEAGRAKWEKIARESSKQARRLLFPEVTSLMSTPEVARLIKNHPTLIMHEKGSNLLSSHLFPQGEEQVIVIGPEGGLTESEVDVFRSAGGRVFSMGDTVLRTSTAGAIAITQVRAFWTSQHGQET
ncbi:MAG: 16S rRNA (uracil(1498)-N(3))-methyltransferase [Propionibacteriaceae bacterium]|nr:16S rRNA (uracil(1498)-N(3))-methyltransferase [Propionibacteriaceae bacterium]